MEDIRENGNILSKAIQYVSEKAVKGKLFPENSIIVATSATVGEFMKLIWMLQIFITIKNFRFTETIRYPI